MANDENLKEKIYKIVAEMKLGASYVDHLLEQCKGSLLCVLNRLLDMQETALDESSNKSLLSDITAEKNIEQREKANRMIQDFVEKTHKSKQGKITKL